MRFPNRIKNEQRKFCRFNGIDTNVVLAFDESVILESGLKTPKQLAQEKKKQDPITWRMEFLNERILENTSAFFTYKMLTENQRLRHVFYPMNNLDFKQKKKNHATIFASFTTWFKIEP